MKVLSVAQGTPEWLAARAQYRTASEAPAMMGASKYQTRADLLAQHALGLTREVDAGTQARFDNGHAVERLARPIVEEMLGEDLYPVTAIDDAGYLLASLDGLTIDDSTIFEHKAWNKDLAAQVVAGDLDPHYYWQLEQQLLVTGAERVVFVTSDGTRANFAHMEYRPVEGRAAALLAGWKQFDQDVANYQHSDTAAPIAATPVLDLPAVSVQCSGSIAIVDNFDAFGAALRDFVETRLIRKPQTDQDFADLDAQIKTLKKAEAALDAAETAMLSQVASVDAMKRTKDLLHKLARDNRLVAEKLLAAEKDNRKGQILQAGKDAVAAVVKALNAGRAAGYLTPPPCDFAAATKGLRSIASMEDAVDNTLRAAKIAAGEAADRIEANLRMLGDMAVDHLFLFADTAQLVAKAPDDLAATIKSRISDHAAAEAKRIEDERAKIRAEEEARAAAKVKAEAEAEARRIAAEKAKADQEAREQEAKQRREDDAAAAKTVAPVTAAELAARGLGAPAAPVTATTHPARTSSADAARLRVVIYGELERMSAEQLQQVLDAVLAISARKAA